MNSELTAIRQLLETYLMMETNSSLSEITRIRLLIEQLVLNGGAGNFGLPFTGTLPNGANYFFGEINDFDSGFGTLVQQGDFVYLNGYYENGFGVGFLPGASLSSDDGDIVLQNNNNIAVSIGIDNKASITNFNTLQSLLEINFDDSSIGFFGHQPAPQQSITALEYANMSAGEQLIVDKLQNYGFIKIQS